MIKFSINMLNSNNNKKNKLVDSFKKVWEYLSLSISMRKNVFPSKLSLKNNEKILHMGMVL